MSLHDDFMIEAEREADRRAVIAFWSGVWTCGASALLLGIIAAGAGSLAYLAYLAW